MDSFLRERYDAMWSGAVGRIRAGEVELDPVLLREEGDLRRGMTLLIRPGEEIRRRVGEFIGELRLLEPEQYYYDGAELHVTFLSMFTSTVEHGPYMARAKMYAEAVTAFAAGLGKFPISFAGITASPAAILVQGFTDSAALNAARDRLREALNARDCGGLDTRYRLETAHMTVVRFRQSLRDAKRFVAALEKARKTDFGAMEVDALELVKNDWYMSRANTERVVRHVL